MGENEQGCTGSPYVAGWAAAEISGLLGQGVLLQSDCCWEHSNASVGALLRLFDFL